ncbi:MAG: response regulator [bacterium]
MFAADAAAATALLGTEAPVLAIVDAALPGGGYDVAGAIKRKSDAKVLLLVGRNENFDMARARDAGIDGHLPKPFLTQQLVEKVFGVLNLPIPDRSLFRMTLANIPLARGPKPGSEEETVVAPAPPASRSPAPPSAVAKATPAPPARQPSAPPKAPSTAPKLPQIPRRPSLPSVPPAPSAEAPAMPSQAPAPPPAGAFAQATPPGTSDLARAAVQQTMARLAADDAVASALNSAARDTAERIAWEVVPRLAEAILKEEIAKVVRERLAAS